MPVLLDRAVKDAVGGDGVAIVWSKSRVNRPSCGPNHLFLLASPRGFEPLLPP